jgi:hypothetical protein
MQTMLPDLADGMQQSVKGAKALYLGIDNIMLYTV